MPAEMFQVTIVSALVLFGVGWALLWGVRWLWRTVRSTSPGMQIAAAAISLLALSYAGWTLFELARNPALTGDAFLRNYLLIVVLALGVLGLVFAGVVVGIYRLFRWLWRKTTPNQRFARRAILCAALFVAALPIIAYWAYDRHRVLARVPAPLEVAEIEFRYERHYGTGGPGDNEVGLVIYRLTDASREWAQSKAAGLGALLPGGTSVWRETPMAKLPEYDDDGELQLIPMTVSNYVGPFGYVIPVERSQEDEVNQAMQKPGSFYAENRRSARTVVDPARGKVYYFYY